MLSDLDLVTPGETTTLTATQSPSSTAKASAAQNKTILVLNSDQGKWQPALLACPRVKKRFFDLFSPLNVLSLRPILSQTVLKF